VSRVSGDGACDVPIGSDPVSLLTRSARDADRTFLVFSDEDGAVQEITYADQVRRAGATAALLTELGVGEGDRVHLMTANRPEFLDVLFAAMALGAVVVPANPLSSVDEVVHQMHDAAAVLSIVDPARHATAIAALARSRQTGDADPMAPVVVPTSELLARRPETAPLPSGPRRGTASIMYTSGTTSRPKGVLVSHENYARVGRAVAHHLAVTEEDRWLVVLPLFHANAQYYCLMSALTVGASVALTSRFSATWWPHQTRELRPTLASLFAAPIRMIMARTPPVPADADNGLRAVLFAQNLTDTQAAAFESRFGAPLVQLYGMTETVLPPLINPLDATRRWDSLGQVLAGTKVKVVDSDGRRVPAGQAGELLVAGAPGIDVTAGYHERPEATAALLDQGWLHTGDLVRFDEHGHAFFVDRVKDMIKRSGENIAAGEVERVINEHPAVLESAVHGVPDPIHDEAVVAHVVLHDGETAGPEELHAWCTERLPRFKVPAQFLMRDDLPRTSVGKIRKDALRAETPTLDLAVPQGATHGRHG
jgi:crotonobetaine/carnitine-CoA ligase